MSDNTARYIQEKDAAGNWHDTIPLDDYMKQHLEEFMPVKDGVIVGSQRITLIIASDNPDEIGTVTIADETTLVLHTDGEGNEWFMRE